MNAVSNQFSGVNVPEFKTCVFDCLTGDSLLPTIYERGNYPPGTEVILYEVIDLL